MIEHVFQRYSNYPDTAPQLIAALIEQIRPPSPGNTAAAIKAIQALCYQLNQDPEKARILREVILSLLSERNPISLFVVARYSVFTGFFTELYRRITHKLLPDAIDPSYLIDLFALFFKPNDDEWVMAVPDAVWQELIAVLRFEQAPPELKQSCRDNILAAAQVLSYRITALGLEPELLRNHPELELHTSPFITQNQELEKFLASPNILVSPHIEDAENFDADIKHILVMLDQCDEVVAKIRRNSVQTGTSIRLTNILQRASQQIERLETLLHILTRESELGSPNLEVVRLFRELVYSECHKNDVGEHWQQNMELMSLRVTENASRTGEHYITSNRSEYYTLMRSAMGAGIIIAIMATLKIVLAKQHFAPLTEAILFSLNYGIGFVIIHILHFTVATKQPAMTAAAIAASIDGSKTKEMDNLVNIITNTTRSQIIAIFGNVVTVIPMAMLIGMGIYFYTGQHFVGLVKSEFLLKDIDPFNSGSLIYASIAGVCLFLSGLIAGYHDNMSIYRKIPQRLRALRWLQILLGPTRLDRVAYYIENNLGALAGNFYFGCLLGGMSGLGVLLGLPIDIRHIAFSSAFVGFSSVGLDFMLEWQTVLYLAFSLVLIGFMNLTVSFALALYVAMKSRRARFKQWRVFIGNLATRLNRHPGEFIMPPKKNAEIMAVTDDDLSRKA